MTTENPAPEGGPTHAGLLEQRLDGIAQRARDAGWNVNRPEDVAPAMQAEIERLRAGLAAQPLAPADQQAGRAALETGYKAGYADGKAAAPGAPAETWAGAAAFIQHTQSAAGAPGHWVDEYLAWYSPIDWCGEHRAAAVFLGAKLASSLDSAQPSNPVAMQASAEGAETVGWRFICKRPGRMAEYLDLNGSGSTCWPWDEWTVVDREPVGVVGVRERVKGEGQPASQVQPNGTAAEALRVLDVLRVRYNPESGPYRDDGFAILKRHIESIAATQAPAPAPEALTIATAALEKLSKLGNGERAGNSIGNLIAQEALAAISSPAVRAEPAPTYSSTQATKCAGCGEHKHTPLRIDAMGGYVCLTCIDTKLGGLLGEFGCEDDPQRKDAERYRWLRQEQQHVEGPAAYAPWGGEVLFNDELDKAIDAALAASRPPVQGSQS